jgi:hypothetical protein
VSEILDDATAVLAALAALDGSGLSPVVIADQYEANKDAYLLLVEASYGGSESVYEEKVGRDRGLHVGSAVVSYVVVAPNCTIVNAGTVSSHMSATNKLGKTAITWGTTST